MYESFYGLSEKPFNLTPDPRYLFLSDKHKEAFAHLLFGIKNRCGFVMVTGEIGTGKTTICRTLLNQLDDDTEVAFIFNPRLSPEDLLRTINEDFGIASKGETAKELIDELNTYLLERNAQGKNCVLVIDESQNLAPPVLEQIRLLSNLETETQKLLQIVLIGQPELAQNLALPELRQLNQRITARYHLKPLDREETAQYVGHRLHTAGGHKKVRFTRGAMKRVYRFSGGTPRVINAVCDRALLVGYTQEVRDITTAIVAKSAKEVRGERIRVKRKPRPADTQPFPWKMVAAAAMVALMLGATLYGPLLLERSAWAPGIFTQNPQPASPDRRVDVARAAVSDALDAAPVRRIENDLEPDALLEEAPEPTAFQRAVGRLEPELPRKAAAQALLRAWRMAMVGDYPGNDSAHALVVFAEQNGFEHETLPLSLEQLKAINLPAFVRMTTDRHPVWVAIVGLEDEGVRVTTTMGGSALIDEVEFDTRYLGEAVLVWRDPRADDPVLLTGARGDSVRALQEALRRAGHYDGAINGVYDTPTESAVSAMQASAGLAVDGKAGRQTRMAVAAWLGDASIPMLAEPAAEALVAAAPVADTPELDAPELSTPVLNAEAQPEVEDTSPTPERPRVTAELLGEPGLLAQFEQHEQSPLPGLDGSEVDTGNAVSSTLIPGDALETAPDVPVDAPMVAAILNGFPEVDSSAEDSLGTMFDALRAAVADEDAEAIAEISASIERIGAGTDPAEESTP